MTVPGGSRWFRPRRRHSTARDDEVRAYRAWLEAQRREWERQAEEARREWEAERERQRRAYERARWEHEEERRETLRIEGFVSAHRSLHPSPLNPTTLLLLARELDRRGRLDHAHMRAAELSLRCRIEYAARGGAWSTAQDVVLSLFGVPGGNSGAPDCGERAG
ncbi:hypothetical protein GCM10010420_04070 [Streptomyces glaucosporus]|uniref:Uncharacterized protein n=1 Tax=Streptomyces glaucosporus TaxID=284044 RepID=A0ABP5UP17_9ACTN